MPPDRETSPPELRQRVRDLSVLLVGILATYALIVGFGDYPLTESGRVLLLALVLIGALRVRRRAGRTMAAAVALTTGLLAVAVVAAATGASRSPRRWSASSTSSPWSPRWSAGGGGFSVDSRR